MGKFFSSLFSCFRSDNNYKNQKPSDSVNIARHHAYPSSNVYTGFGVHNINRSARPPWPMNFLWQTDMRLCNNVLDIDQLRAGHANAVTRISERDYDDIESLLDEVDQKTTSDSQKKSNDMKNKKNSNTSFDAGSSEHANVESSEEPKVNCIEQELLRVAQEVAEKRKSTLSHLSPEEIEAYYRGVSQDSENRHTFCK